MSKSAVSLLLFFVTLASASLAGFLLWERGGVQSRLIESAVKQKQLEAEIAALRQERERLTRRAPHATPAQESKAQAAAAQAPPPKKEGEAPASAASAVPGGKMFAEMMKNPAMKEVVKQQQLALLDSQYGALYEKLQLSDAEKADFKQLLGERLMLQAELGIKMMAEGTGKPQRDALMKEFEESKKASDADIREFLNSDEDFSTFQRWEDTKSERMQLDMGRSQFAGSGEPLSPDQEQQLVNAMYQARTDPRYGKDPGKPGNYDPSDFNDAEIDRQIVRYDNIARDVYQSASRFLSPRQLEALLAAQQQWRTMTKAGLQMSAMMFKSQKGN